MTAARGRDGGTGRAAVFLDRDGTVIVDRHYLGDPAGVELIPGAAEAIRTLNGAGITVLLVTNQSGIGRGFFTEGDFKAVQARLMTLLAQRGARLDGVYHCPHAPDQNPPCDCRKPYPGLFLRAAAEHDIELARSFLVGDRPRDVEPALALGARAFLLRDREDIPADATDPPAGVEVVSTLPEAVMKILRQLQRIDSAQ